MELINDINAAGYELEVQGVNLKFVYKGEGAPDIEKVKPLIIRAKKYKPQIIKELQKDLCQRCLISNWQRLCWGSLQNNRTGWGSFCLKCEPYPKYAERGWRK